jgi:hypothetical protein
MSSVNGKVQLAAGGAPGGGAVERSQYKYLGYGDAAHSAELTLLATYVTPNIALHHEGCGK